MVIRKSAFVVLAFIFLYMGASVTASGETLRDNFKNPPRQYSLLPFWAWNDTLEPEKLKWQIDQMVEKNVYGAFMHARIGINKGETPYFSQGWWDAVDASIKHGEKVGFYPWLYDEDKWPSGCAGGRTVAANPEEFSQKGLKYSKMEVDGPQNIQIPAVEKLVVVIAAKISSRGKIDEQTLRDISEFSGKQWSVPEGKWLVMTFEQIIEEDTKQGIDYLDKKAVAEFLKNTHEEYYKRFGKYFGNVTSGIFFDEITAKAPQADFAWTDDFLEQFKERKGYDLKKYLPLLIYDSDAKSTKIRCDYYDVFSTLYTEAWFEQIAKWCSEHNISLTGHSYEDIYSYMTQGNYFRTFAPVQIPMTDNEEFRYSYPPYIEWYKPKQLSSIAHLNGRKLAGVEALGGCRWSYTLQELRYGLSMLAVYGMNFMVLHGFYYTIDTPLTNSDYPPSWFYQNPHWKYFGKVGKFAQRILYMGTVGDHVCDVAVLYPITSQWASGKYPHAGGLGKKYTIEEMEDIVNRQYYDIQEALLKNQIDYDVINPDSILKADVSGGKIKIEQEKYSVLILPPLSAIRTDVLKQIKSFWENGGVVIALNTLPKSSMEMGKNDPVIIQSINDIFGFNPQFLRSGYFETDETYTKKYVVNKSKKGGKAHLTKAVGPAISIVESSIDKDVIIKEGDPKGFHFLHKAEGNYDIYYLMNGQKVPKKLLISFRAEGAIEKWHPETGQIERMYGIGDGNGRTEVTLWFESWESYYLVIDKSKKADLNVVLRDTNLTDVKISASKKDKILVEGYTSNNIDSLYVDLTAGSSRKNVRQQIKKDGLLSELQLTGQWDFIAAGDSLDYKWQSSLTQSQIELPVMQFCIERDSEAIPVSHSALSLSKHFIFKRVKIKDTANEISGCGRYLSSWDGWWITYVDLKPHWGTLGGKQIRFRKKVNIGEQIEDGWLAVTADEEYEIFINGKSIGKNNNFKDAEVYEVKSYLKDGENLIEVTVKGKKSHLGMRESESISALLVQGLISLKDGKSIRLVSDDTWDVCDQSGIWVKAFECVNPPLSPWGNIELKKEPLKFPVKVWYRQQLPAGSVGMMAPVIKGDFKIFVNGKEIKFKAGEKQITFGKLPNSKKNFLSIKVDVKDYSEGLIEPVTVLCEPAKVELGLWENYGLDWYSGRCVYSKEFVVPEEYIADDTKLVLDLGQVRHFAEIWINDKLVDTKIWPGYEVEVHDYLKADKNSISVVVANLIANKAKWNIYDNSLTAIRTRWVHDINLLRNPEMLNSGLLGPVKIIPFKKHSVEISILD